ncbi:MAG TPA: hypothetical protein VF835_00080 [Rhizomicrobium sp.]
MAANQESTGKDKDKTAARQEKAASRQKRREGRAEKVAKREAARQQKIAEGGKAKPQRLCSLATVEVKKGSDGFHVSVSGSQGSKTFHVEPAKANQVLRDLETAIVVMRSQQ